MSYTYTYTYTSTYRQTDRRTNIHEYGVRLHAYLASSSYFTCTSVTYLGA